MALSSHIDHWRRSGLLSQLVRFGIAGGLSTLIYSAVYLPLTYWVLPRAWAVLAVPPAFLVAVICGFFLHSGWSFRGHAAGGQGARLHMKFLVVQSFGFVLNALFTWIATALLHQPPWVALIPAATVTPLATFFLNRQWVFG
ncbi:GtrA family protein [Sphingomonas sp. S-NIH.Pt15_0812]|uniref:GtrA family protein n=1 Tax=Sphingomonas sp. S-NIH.Pt15_0812 TaxID=1920129 RepID=UPI001F497FEC|nr:GtrA family protein [Sphingomonas sp. S-NIH.Pt15_0812]